MFSTGQFQLFPLNLPEMSIMTADIASQHGTRRVENQINLFSISDEFFINLKKMKRFKNNNLFNIFHLYAPPCRHTLGGKWITNCVCCYVLISTHRMLAHVKIHFMLSMLNCSREMWKILFARTSYLFFLDIFHLSEVNSSWNDFRNRLLSKAWE